MGLAAAHVQDKAIAHRRLIQDRMKIGERLCVHDALAISTQECSAGKIRIESCIAEQNESIAFVQTIQLSCICIFLEQYMKVLGVAWITQAALGPCQQFEDGQAWN